MWCKSVLGTGTQAGPVLVRSCLCCYFLLKLVHLVYIWVKSRPTYTAKRDSAPLIARDLAKAGPKFASGKVIYSTVAP